MSAIRKLRSQKGFTLVELLIVVAIIGVLSTIGVPTFRKMIQKAKKSEAKVNLGGLYTAEHAFYSEYGVYGNSLAGIGFEMDGQTFIYAVGFMAASNCASVSVVPASGGGALAKATLAAYPDYGSDTATKAGNPSLAACPFGTMAGYGSTTANVYDNGGELGGFVAAAVGAISPNVSSTSPGAGEADVWGIDEKRKLANIIDGVGKKTGGGTKSGGTSSGSGTGSGS